MGRDAIIYWRNLRTGRIKSTLGPSCHYFEPHQYLDGVKDEFPEWEEMFYRGNQWMLYDRLRDNLCQMMELHRKHGKAVCDFSKAADVLEDVLKHCRKRASSCEFLILAEGGWEAPELGAYYEQKAAESAKKQERRLCIEAVRNTKVYEQVKRELAEKIRRQWE